MILSEPVNLMFLAKLEDGLLEQKQFKGRMSSLKKG